jgi:hypothetical protein
MSFGGQWYGRRNGKRQPFDEHAINKSKQLSQPEQSDDRLGHQSQKHKHALDSELQSQRLDDRICRDNRLCEWWLLRP